MKQTPPLSEDRPDGIAFADEKEELFDDDEPTTSEEPVHKQGRFFFEFTNPDTEARFIEYRFGSVGFYFFCAVGFVAAFMTISSTVARFQTDILRSSPAEWFFNDASWQAEKYAVTRYYYYVNAILQGLGTGALLLYNIFVRKSAPLPGKYMAIFIMLLCASQTSTHTLLDYRYEVFCEENSWSVHLRDDKVVSHCDDFVEPYVPISFMNAFILLPRFKDVLIMAAIFLPAPFYLRYPIGYDYLFRASDAVWFFNAFFYLICFAAYEFTLRKQFIQHEIVEQEAEETKRAQDAVSRLLDAMLPASVLKRLIANEKISDAGVVSVVFSDVAGFTAWCSSHKAQAVVSMLNTMYTHFDGGLQRYGIEKVKTIGDAYWAICGLPDPNPNHIMHICAFAKFMLRCVTRMGEENVNHLVHIRIGVTSGNVCGGLVGTQQSTYDMFGTTNEVAELMEQRAPVDGILISEMSYNELLASKLLSEDELVVELQDEGLETAQGTISTYVLKTFTWMPQNETMTTNTKDSVVVSDAANSIIHGDDASDQSRSTNCGDGGAETPKPAEPTDAAQVLSDLKAKLSAASHKVFHTFDDEEVEAEFQQFMRTVFPNKLKAVNSMLGGMIFLIYVVMLAEGHSHPWYTHFMMVLDLLITVGACLVVDRFALHPLIGLAIFYAECNLLVFALFSANRSLVSMDLVYLIFNFAVFYPTLGYVGGNAPYLYICAANILFLLSPTLIIMAAVKSIFVAHFHIPAVFAALWIIALRRSEITQRDQFINMKLADVALQQTRTQHEKVSELLSRMVPSFIVDELTIWVCGPRTKMIASNFSLVGILFARVPALHEQFSDKTIDPITVMGLIGNYANVCDSVLDRFSDCTKLKIIGDILLFASGLAANSKPAIDGSTSVDTMSLCSNDRVSSDVTSESNRSGDAAFQHHHLLSLAHLATTLAAQVEDHFDGAKISAGMHCGTATGGVIGNDRLIYDVFGDTVNTASRVMSTSGEGVWASVKFSTKLSSLGSNQLVTGDRVERVMKGKGTMHVVSVSTLPT